MRANAAAGQDILPRARKARAVLAILALADHEPVPRQRLSALLWSNRPEDQGRNSLRQSVHELHQCFEPFASGLLLAERHTLALDWTRWDVDVDCLLRPDVTMEQALTLLDAGACASGGRLLLENFVELGEPFSAWLSAQRHRLSANAIAIAETALKAALELSPARDPVFVRSAAERVVRLAPARESAWRNLMKSCLDAGDHAGAARAFERCAASLARAGSGPPSSETRLLAQRIRHAAAERHTQRTTEHEGSPPRSLPISEPVRIETGIRLGIMAFRDLDGSAQSSDMISLCAGLTEEITVAMARFRGIRLIGDSNLQAATDPPGTMWAVPHSRDPRLDFLLDGTVQRSGNQVRITAKLLDMRAADMGGELVWSRRFDRPATNLLTLQEEIAAETVAQIDPEMMLRAASKPGGQMRDGPALPTASAHELMLRAVPALYRVEERKFRAAGEALGQAIERNPDLATAHAWYAYWHLFLMGQGWAADPAAAMGRAGELADRAVSLDPTDARALTIAGHVRAFLCHDIDEALALHERAIELNPNLSLAWVLYGLGLCYAGRHEEALAKMGQARRLSPFDPHGFFFDTALSLPLMLLGRLSEALGASRRAAAMNPVLSSSYKGYLAALGLLASPSSSAKDRSDLAIIRAHLTRLEPGFTVSAARARSPLRREQDLATYLDGLRRAGLPEE